jgi:hypothetical protein
MVKNEFECVHVKRFTEPDVVQFTEAVDATHGMYEHRCVLVCHKPSYPQATCAAREECPDRASCPQALCAARK